MASHFKCRLTGALISHCVFNRILTVWQPSSRRFVQSSDHISRPTKQRNSLNLNHDLLSSKILQQKSAVKTVRRTYHGSHASKASGIARREDWELPDASSRCSKDAKGACGKRLVLWATANGDTNLMALLLGLRRSNLSFTNCYGQTALSLAAEHGHRDAVQLLIERSDTDINSQDIDGQTPLAWATFHGHTFHGHF